jgi:heptosyltransferase-2
LSRTLVIRFGALGDLCLLAWSLAAYARSRTGDENAGDAPVALATKASYAELMTCVPGVGTVHALTGSRLRDLLRLARRLRAERPAEIIDAHGSLRSRFLLTLLGRGADRRLAKDTAARLSLLFLRRRGAPLARSMRDRFDELFDLAAADPTPVQPPLAEIALATADPVRRLGLAPGARWDTKRWPTPHFAEFLQRFRRADRAPVRIFLGPQEESWFDGSSLAKAAAELPDVEILRNGSLREVAAALGGCTTLLTNDSGLLHLAEAVGTPVLALFGPTVAEFGYFPGLPESRVLQLPLDCRPCSRNGKRPCWRQDQACLAEIPAARVLEQLLALPPWNGAGSEGGGGHV